MPSIPTPEEDPVAWDTLQLGGVRLPGIVILSPNTKRDYDVQKAKGKTKATIKNNGDPPRKLKFEWLVDMERDWSAVQDAMATIDPLKENKTLEPQEVIHPLASFYGIHTVLVESIEGPRIEHGLGKFQVELLEREKPKPAVGVGGSAKGVAAANLDKQYAYLKSKLAEIDAAMAEAAAAGDEQTLKALATQRQAILNQMQKPSASGVQKNA